MKVKPISRVLAKSAAAPIADTHVFARLFKVDTVNRMVYGRAVQEVPDASGEIFDYKSSKPYFEKWVADTKEATAGKSLGNIRAMHGAIAAGKAVEVTFQDDECAIDLAAKIVDDNEWAKVLEGVYTGFSIGGSYVGKKQKDGDLMRYTASPTEISLVDKPCIPTAMFYDVVKAQGFTVIKADGVEDHVEFKLEAEAPVAKVDDPEVPGDVEIVGSAEEVAAFGKVLTDAGLTLAKATKMVATQITVEAPKRFADAANKKYPLDNDAQVLAAWYFVNTAKAAELYEGDALKALQDEVTKAFEERFGKAPDAIEADAAKKLLTSDATLTKSFYAVASAADLLRSLSYFMADMEYWEAVEMEPVGITGKILVCIQGMSAVISELISAAEAEGAEGMEVVRSLQSVTSVLKKSVADHDAAASIQKAHDLLLAHGAKCAAEEAPAPVEKVEGGEDLAKLSAVVVQLSKDLELLKAAPRAPRAVLRVVAKNEDTGNNEGTLENLIQKTPPVLDRDGKVDVAATAIKMLHAAKGVTNPQSA